MSPSPLLLDVTVVGHTLVTCDDVFAAIISRVLSCGSKRNDGRVNLRSEPLA